MLQCRVYVGGRFGVPDPSTFSSKRLNFYGIVLTIQDPGFLVKDKGQAITT